MLPYLISQSTSSSQDSSLPTRSWLASKHQAQSSARGIISARLSFLLSLSPRLSLCRRILREFIRQQVHELPFILMTNDFLDFFPASTAVPRRMLTASWHCLPAAQFHQRTFDEPISKMIFKSPVLWKRIPKPMPLLINIDSISTESASSVPFALDL